MPAVDFDGEGGTRRYLATRILHREGHEQTRVSAIIGQGHKAHQKFRRHGCLRTAIVRQPACS